MTPEVFTHRPLSEVAAFSFDAAAAAALALAAAEDPSDAASVIAALKGVSFIGISGDVRFDSKGDTGRYDVTRDDMM